MGKVDFPSSPVVENPPSNAEDAGLIPSRGIKIPHGVGPLSPHTTTREEPASHSEDPVCRNTDPVCCN